MGAPSLYLSHHSIRFLSPKKPLFTSRMLSVLNNLIDWTELDLRYDQHYFASGIFLCSLEIRRVYSLPLSAFTLCSNIKHLDIRHIIYRLYAVPGIGFTRSATGDWVFENSQVLSSGSSSKAVSRLLSARRNVRLSISSPTSVSLDIFHPETNRNLFKFNEQLENSPSVVSMTCYLLASDQLETWARYNVWRF